MTSLNIRFFIQKKSVLIGYDAISDKQAVSTETRNAVVFSSAARHSELDLHNRSVVGILQIEKGVGRHLLCCDDFVG